MKILVVLLGAFVFTTFYASGDTLTDEQLEADKVEFQRWTNKLYGLFGRKADIDKDGILSIAELRGHCDNELKDHKTSKNDLLLRIIKKQNPKMDQNKDGILTKPELLTYMDLFIDEDEEKKEQ